MVVDDHDPRPGGQQVGGLGLLRAVGVHHHHHRVGPCQPEGLLRGDEQPPVLRQGHQLADLLLRRVGGGGPDGPDGHALLPGDGTNPGHRPHHVQVGVGVAHDDDLVGAGQQLGQGGGHHPALHLGAALHLFGPAAEEEEFRAVLHHGLVSPPAEGHVQGQGGKGVQLPRGLPLAAKAHGEGGRHAVGALHLADLIQDGELFPVGVPEGAGLPNQEVVVPLIPQQDGPGGLQPLHQAVVDLRADGRALPLFQAPDQVLVVVHL